MALQLAGANSQRLHGAVHRVIREPSGLTDAFAEPDDARKRVDHAKAAARGAGEQQPAVVGAEIEGSVDRIAEPSKLLADEARKRALPGRIGGPLSFGRAGLNGRSLEVRPRAVRGLHLMVAASRHPASSAVDGSSELSGWTDRSAPLGCVRT